MIDLSEINIIEKEFMEIYPGLNLARVHSVLWIITQPSLDLQIRKLY